MLGVRNDRALCLCHSDYTFVKFADMEREKKIIMDAGEHNIVYLYPLDDCNNCLCIWSLGCMAFMGQDVENSVDNIYYDDGDDKPA